MQIVFENLSKRLKSADLNFTIAALDLQMKRDFCPKWGFNYWPVSLVSDVKKLPKGTYHPIFILDNIGDPNALGFHDDQLGYIYGRVLAQDLLNTGTTASHEALEMRGDPDCSQWRPTTNGNSTAKEACDAVEADTYYVSVTVNGTTKNVGVSNFILPSWFDPKGKGPFDFMGKLTAPLTMTPGGYMIIKDAQGNVNDVFARGAGPSARKMLALKKSDPMSRTARRHGLHLKAA